MNTKKKNQNMQNDLKSIKKNGQELAYSSPNHKVKSPRSNSPVGGYAYQSEDEVVTLEYLIS